MRGSDEDTNAKSGDEPKKKGDALDAYCVNLNKKAREGKIDPLIGREAEINRTIQVLCRRQKNNPLFVGEAGVGKTAIAEGLARRIVPRAPRGSRRAVRSRLRGWRWRRRAGSGSVSGPNTSW